MYYITAGPASQPPAPGEPGAPGSRRIPNLPARLARGTSRPVRARQHISVLKLFAKGEDITEIGRESPRFQPWDESPEILGQGIVTGKGV